MKKLLLAVAAWEFCWWNFYKRERRKLYEEARHRSGVAKKPMLVVGEPDGGEYPCPSGPMDVLVDIRPRSVCANYVQASVEDLQQFPDGHFGACFVSHVIEHVCDPTRAMAELRRVADRVFISYPRPYTLLAFLVPGHKWIMWRRSVGWRFVQIRQRCNVPTRLGNGVGLAVIDCL